jgi:heme/copper-type cytochrome/quinol oxidase subunit 3
MMVEKYLPVDEQHGGNSAVQVPVPQPATSPLSDLTPGRFGMWVFLSTEIMLFAGCIAAVLVLRISALEHGWPSAASMGTDFLIGLLNTALLVVSGLTATAAAKNALRNRPGAAKTLLLVTFLLGSAFMAVKFSEYRHKYQIGLLSLSPSQNVFDKADRQYLSAVDESLLRQISRLEQLKESRPLDERESGQLEWAYRLRGGMTVVVANRIARGLDAQENQVQLDLLAWQIFPNKELFGSPKEAVDQDNRLLTELAESIETRIGLARNRIALLESHFSAMEKSATDAGDEGERSETVKLPPDLTAEEWLESRRAQQLELKAEIESLNRELGKVRDRQQILGLISGEESHVGINNKIRLRLPVAVKNGQAWTSSWLLLSGMHGFHVIAGLVAFLFFLPARLDATRAASLGVVVLYWQFVDVVWLLIFGLLYF